MDGDYQVTTRITPLILARAVYRARDTRLEGTVALKVIRAPELHERERPTVTAICGAFPISF
jgi:hypothetical protein